jgi:hypothetical protein
MKQQRHKTDLVQISIRTKEPLRAALESAARERGVSMNAEIVERLTRTFEDEIKLEAEFDRRQLYAILRIMAAAMDHAGHSAAIVTHTVSQSDGMTWLDEPFAYDQAVQAATHILEAFRPSGKPTPVPGRFSRLGEEFAAGVLETIVNEKPTAIGETQIPPRSHRELGHLLARIFLRKSKNRGRSQASKGEA